MRKKQQNSVEIKNQTYINDTYIFVDYFSDKNKKQTHGLWSRWVYLFISIFAIFKISECTDGAEKVVWQLTKSAWILKK